MNYCSARVTDEKDKGPSRILELTAQIVCAELNSGRVAPGQPLSDLIQQVYNTLVSLEGMSIHPLTKRTPFIKPVVSIGNSVTPSYIICLEDGKKVKMLRRYLKVNYNMEPEEYRRRWGLPDDYPMVAPDYAKQRSDLAKTMGLGKKRNDK